MTAGEMMEEMIAGAMAELSEVLVAAAKATEGQEGEDAEILARVCKVILDLGLKFERSRRLEQGDLAVQLAPICARAKTNPVKGASLVAAQVEQYLSSLSDAAKSARLVSKVTSAGPYLNVSLNRPMVYKRVVEAVLSLKEKYGNTEFWKGKRVIVEHTSSNPNAPLHIGNLRNVMIGAHAARLIASPPPASMIRVAGTCSSTCQSAAAR